MHHVLLQLELFSKTAIKVQCVEMKVFEGQKLNIIFLTRFSSTSNQLKPRILVVSLP